jgi:protein-glutamine gamma-glutamyltransferase
MLDVPYFHPVKTPPFVLGATLLFWGWQTDFLLPGALMALVLEASRFLKLRWDLSDDDFKRIWTFCALLFLAAAVYAFADNGGPEGFGKLFGGPDIMSERQAGSASAKTAAALIRWLPMIFFLFIGAQAFSTKQEIPLYTISLILQRRWRRAKKLGQPPPIAEGVDVAYPYFAVCLFASSVHRNQNNTFFWGLCLLLAWVLWVRRPRRFGLAVWFAALIAAIVSGYVGAQGVGYVQRYAESLNMQLVARLLSRGHTDPTKSQTQIGSIGRVETSPQVVIWLRPISGEFPTYLREASYRSFRSPTWFANQSKADLMDINHAGTNENTWPLGLNKTNASRIGIACYLTERSRDTRDPEGLLPLPTGTARLENLPAYYMRKNSRGAVIADGPGLVQFEAVYGPGGTIDSVAETNTPVWNFGDRWGTNGYGTNATRFPQPNLMRARGTDLQIPTNEIPALDAVVDELNLRGKSRQEVLASLSEFFSTKFTYRMWQDADSEEESTNSALGRFLLKTRAGHCEYFATATVLLLRDLGIPARYAVGYSVHESQWSGYVVRQSDSHAWCLVWDDEKRIWEDFDTTPGNGVEEHHNRASLWFADAWGWVHFQISKIRWGQTHLRNYILMGLVPVLALLLFQIVRQRRRFQGKGPGGRRAAVWPGLDSEFYQIEKQLADRGLVRGLDETLADWLERAAAEPSLVSLKAPLRGLLRLHYRYRFDPQGLSDSDRDELRREARECLDKLTQLEKPATAT